MEITRKELLKIHYRDLFCTIWCFATLNAAVLLQQLIAYPTQSVGSRQNRATEGL